MGNQAEITQGFVGGISTVSGQAVISDDNEASILQEGDEQVARLQQGGVGNRAQVSQSGVGNVLKGAAALQEVAQQLGNQNLLQVNQLGQGGINQANVTQIGTGNATFIGQVNP